MGRSGRRALPAGYNRMDLLSGEVVRVYSVAAVTF